MQRRARQVRVPRRRSASRSSDRPSVRYDATYSVFFAIGDRAGERQRLPAGRRLVRERALRQQRAGRRPERAGVRAGVVGALVEPDAGDRAGHVGAEPDAEGDRHGVGGLEHASARWSSSNSVHGHTPGAAGGLAVVNDQVLPARDRRCPEASVRRQRRRVAHEARERAARA